METLLGEQKRIYVNASEFTSRYIFSFKDYDSNGSKNGSYSTRVSVQTFSLEAGLASRPSIKLSLAALSKAEILAQNLN